MKHVLVCSDFTVFCQKKKKSHILILNLGCPLDDSRYFGRLELAKNDGNKKKNTPSLKNNNNCATRTEDGNNRK